MTSLLVQPWDIKRASREHIIHFFIWRDNAGRPEAWKRDAPLIGMSFSGNQGYICNPRHSLSNGNSHWDTNKGRNALSAMLRGMHARLAVTKHKNKNSKGPTARFKFSKGTLQDFAVTLTITPYCHYLSYMPQWASTILPFTSEGQTEGLDPGKSSKACKHLS